MPVILHATQRPWCCGQIVLEIVKYRKRSTSTPPHLNPLADLVFVIRRATRSAPASTASIPLLYDIAARLEDREAAPGRRFARENASHLFVLRKRMWVCVIVRGRGADDAQREGRTKRMMQLDWVLSIAESLTIRAVKHGQGKPQVA
ncbi:predicted protein [Pyrenophora tritici-repentis Pt-1C-BFP]|uniref:Uncharacterized protein n=1 Tax=Pyrenophora tritici-repentis (strain Pt-1C-BFP) TaxID=426418 RepID=B2WLW8_PYRTR|nr:uncharacterized protein PTRG_10978 [Pyrenophora tritici-repentis Pt-1C-BFP]EDU44028.1 predicted protein [Pyrenophora tritici-repentis Pt-1C-BFP]